MCGGAGWVERASRWDGLNCLQFVSAVFTTAIQMLFLHALCTGTYNDKANCWMPRLAQKHVLSILIDFV
ncbi:unnamed protein product [Peronospora belbahrii]|uniref:Uncharacterized protein n=1 Tax=Peronospora belbahrii TaxID=622444 RepID=A0ABN8D4Q8_9STRA|nr:unnamed protein product [Peronospora belbahrii]